MELKYKSAEKNARHSFYLRRENVPYLEGNWHYHEEFELIYVLKGEGIRIVGDNLSNFGPLQLSFNRAVATPFLFSGWNSTALNKCFGMD